jgi:hypothetical protein
MLESAKSTSVSNIEQKSMTLNLRFRSLSDSFILHQISVMSVLLKRSNIMAWFFNGYLNHHFYLPHMEYEYWFGVEKFDFFRLLSRAFAVRKICITPKAFPLRTRKLKFWQNYLELFGDPGA